MSDEASSPYRKVQAASILIYSVILGACALFGIAFFTAEPLIFLIVAATLLLVLYPFRSLTVEVDARALRCYFGGGWIHRRFPLEEIQSARAVKNRWFLGWGIRLIPGGWMFNVAGFDAVELRRKNGRLFRVGTEEPRVLLEALTSRGISEA